jgi:hypothetical protein
MNDNKFDARLHRTWLQYLISTNQREIAALVLDGEIITWSEDYTHVEVIIHLPISSFVLIESNKELRERIITSFRAFSRGYIVDGNNREHYDYPISLRVQLADVEENWQEIVRELITNAKDPNQAVVTEKVYLRNGKQPLIYNEMKFASQSEIRIAQELENRKVLFFPLPLAVRNDTGVRHQDHREVDFLICKDGVWGILEISHHENRYEKDSEKDTWFKKSGILCVEHRTAERCYNSPKLVVDEFLNILAHHKR